MGTGSFSGLKNLFLEAGRLLVQSLISAYISIFVTVSLSKLLDPIGFQCRIINVLVHVYQPFAHFR